MAQQLGQRNPFMLMINPEKVLAAVERSERLSQLNRHMCRPLDRPAAGTNTSQPNDANISEDDAGPDQAD